MFADIHGMVEQCGQSYSAQSTLISIIKVESGGNPFAINVNGKKKLTKQPSSKSQAIVWAESLVKQGFNIDVGIAQINIRNIEKFGYTIAQAFDTCTNIALANTIFTSDYARAVKLHGPTHSAVVAAMSAYNTGSFTAGIQNGYVSKVLNAAGIKNNKYEVANASSSSSVLASKRSSPSFASSDPHSKFLPGANPYTSPLLVALKD